MIHSVAYVGSPHPDTWHLRWGELQGPAEVAFEIRPKPCRIGPCAQSSLYQSKLAESLGRTVLQIPLLHPQTCQIFPLASHFLPHFFLSFASIFYLTLRSCLELLPFYGNMLYLHNYTLSLVFQGPLGLDGKPVSDNRTVLGDPSMGLPLWDCKLPWGTRGKGPLRTCPRAKRSHLGGLFISQA